MIRQIGKRQVQNLLQRLGSLTKEGEAYDPPALLRLIETAGAEIVSIKAASCTVITEGRRVRLGYGDLTEALGCRLRAYSGSPRDNAPGYTWITYAVRDPDTGSVVYVGQTGDYERRKRDHQRISPDRPRISTSNIKTWMWDTITAGKQPVFEALETCSTEEASLDSEIRWVENFTRQGHKLLNRWKIHREIIKART